jgi:UDP-N-acetylglucosamine transferase subunit ALG13
MILVVLGTWDMPFPRPLREIEQAVADGLIRDEVLAQSGKTPYQSSRMRITPFFDRAELEKLYEQASLVICQAGVGSIMLGLRKGKKVVAIARRYAHDEHIDDHQLEILDAMVKGGFILAWQGEGDLPDVLKRVEGFQPAQYPFGKERISTAILDYLEQTVKGDR